MQTTHGPATLRRSKRAALPPLGHASEEGTLAHMHRQQTTNTRHPHGRSAAAPIGHQSEGRRAGHGSGRHRAWEHQATRSTKHKGRGKSEHTDRDLSLGHMRVPHHTSCVRTRPTAVNNWYVWGGHAKVQRQRLGLACACM
eukprot:scaffold33407_cov112-Isochrysis_galbana.AAC.10